MERGQSLIRFALPLTLYFFCYYYCYYLQQLLVVSVCLINLLLLLSPSPCYALLECP